MLCINWFPFFTGELLNKQDDNCRSENLYLNDEEDVVVQQPDVSNVSPEIISHIWIMNDDLMNDGCKL